MNINCLFGLKIDCSHNVVQIKEQVTEQKRDNPIKLSHQCINFESSFMKFCFAWVSLKNFFLNRWENQAPGICTVHPRDVIVPP